MGLTVSKAFDWFFQAVGLKSKRLEFYYDFPPYRRNTGGGTLAAFGYRLTRWGKLIKFTPSAANGVRLTASSFTTRIEFDLPSVVTHRDPYSRRQPVIKIEDVNVIYWIKANCKSRVDIFVTLHSEKTHLYKTEHMVSLTFVDPKEAMLFKLTTGSVMKQV